MREAVHLLVVPGYGTGVDAPGSVTRGKSLRVTASAERPRGPGLSSAKVVVANEDASVRTTASMTEDGYATTVDTGDLPAGTHEVYANVRGPDRAFGERELLGLTAGEPLTVETADVTPTEAPGGGAAGGTTSTASSTPTATPAPTVTDASSAPNGVTAPLDDALATRPGVTVPVDAPMPAAIPYADKSIAGVGPVTVRTHERPADAVAAQFDADDVLTSVTVESPAAATDARASLQFGRPRRRSTTARRARSWSSRSSTGGSTCSRRR